MPRYFIYCRKSTEAEDRQVLSIESQTNELQRLAEKQGLSVLAILTEARSAKYCLDETYEPTESFSSPLVGGLVGIIQKTRSNQD